METEQEQIEAIKKWWKDNGRVVVTGLVLGLGGVLGWTSWQSYVESRAALASQQYSQLLDTAAREAPDQVLAQSQRIVDEFPGSGYAALAALVGAKVAHDAGRLDEARARLQWVRDEGPRPELRDLARLRLARLALGAGDLDGVLREVEAIEGAGFAIAQAELRGDVAVARGDGDAARGSYERVLASADLPAATRERVRMKLDDLGHTLVR